MMRKIILTMLGVSLATAGFSQENVFPENGNVGIGLNNPHAYLHMYKPYNVNNINFMKMFYLGSWGTAPYATAFRFLDIESSEGGKILQLNGYGMGIGFDPPAYSSPDKLYINGRVGIGTTSPVNTFQVQHATTNYETSLTLKNTANHIAARVGITLENDYGNQTVIYKQASGNSDANDLIIYSASGDTRLFTSGTERLRINNAGNIGIGTETPREKLSVNGKIRAQEIKVEATNWPDYVFAKDYSIPTLAETEKHISEKGHLPGIPSAEEVKNNGIDLGEMNAKLLQKIEELTLHLIEKDKQLNQLVSDYASQKVVFANDKKLISKLLERIEVLEANNLKR
jgi:hypothetical protein